MNQTLGGKSLGFWMLDAGDAARPDTTTFMCHKQTPRGKTLKAPGHTREHSEEHKSDFNHKRCQGLLRKKRSKHTHTLTVHAGSDWSQSVFLIKPTPPTHARLFSVCLCLGEIHHPTTSCFQNERKILHILTSQRKFRVKLYKNIQRKLWVLYSECVFYSVIYY